MPKKNHISFFTNVDKSQIKDNGDYFDIESVPVTVDGAVMNGLLYPAEENEKGMKSIKDKVVTLSHPADEDGQPMDAYNGESIQKFYSGGYITSNYRQNGVHMVNVRIKKSILKAQEDGEEFYNKLMNKEPIGVSTGLYTVVDATNGKTESGEEYQGIATNQEYNHLAMLKDSEPPAGGDATFMRFNSDNVAHSMVINLDDVLKANSKGLDFSEGLEAKSQEIRRQAKKALESYLEIEVEDDDELDYIYVRDVNDDTILYHMDGACYAISYTMSGGAFRIDGEPSEVTESPRYEKVDDGLVARLFNKIKQKFAKEFSGGYNNTVNHTKEDLTMAQADVLAKLFGINSDEVKALSDADFEAKLNTLGKNDQGDVLEAINGLKAELKDVKAKLNEKEDAQRDQQINDLVDADVGLEADDLKELSPNALQKLHTKHCTQTNGLHTGKPKDEEQSSIANSKLPGLED